MVADTDIIECTDWNAWHDRMPGVEPTLHVTGECRCRTPEYIVELRVHEPQGSNPRDLLLDLVATAPPAGNVPDVISPCAANFSLETTTDYDTVSIIGIVSSIPVEEVC